MTQQELITLLKQGVKQWNQWRREHPEETPDLSFANLSEAHLYRANLIGANLSEAHLNGANLSEAHLNGANLSEANLNGANLSEAHLSDANLDSANLSGAALWSTVFASNDLRKVKGLTQINHRGPSIIQLYNVMFPQDGSALHFLRGAGLPDAWIDFYRAEMMISIQYHSCFISYSTADDLLAHRLHADLQAHGVRCWFAPHDMKIGDKIRSRINEAIHLQEKLLLLLSESALESDWVEDEVEIALEKEKKQHREVLFPMHLDDSIMQAKPAWTVKVRGRHIGDFSQWKQHDAYQQGFERLLRDLKRSDEIATP